MPKLRHKWGYDIEILTFLPKYAQERTKGRPRPGVISLVT